MNKCNKLIKHYHLIDRKITLCKYYIEFVFSKKRKEIKPRKNNHISQPEWLKKTLLHDNFQCRKCGNKINIVVHHLDESRKLGYKNMNNNPENLITLCKRCHAEIHGQTEKQKPHEVMTLYGKGYTFQEIGNHLNTSRQRAHQLYKKCFDVD